MMIVVVVYSNTNILSHPNHILLIPSPFTINPFKSSSLPSLSCIQTTFNKLSWASKRLESRIQHESIDWKQEGLLQSNLIVFMNTKLDYYESLVLNK